MARNVTGAIFGDPGHGDSAAVRALTPRPSAEMAADRVAASTNRALANVEPEQEPDQPEAHDAAEDASKPGRTDPGPQAKAEPPPPTLRPIRPIDFGEELDLKPIPDDIPSLEWIKPADMLVAESYQRDLGERGRALVRRIAEGFDWKLYKPPIVVLTDKGYEVVDGQHTALGAALRPDITEIPALVILAAEEKDRAAAFVGHNTNRLAVTAMQVHRARLVAGDEQAHQLEEIIAEAGVSLVYGYNGSYPWKRGETVAVNAIRGLIGRRSREMVVAVLRTAVATELLPLKADTIKAVEYLLTDPYYEMRLEPLPTGGEHIAATARRLGSDALNDATFKARADRIPAWKALALIWFAACRHKRAA